MGRRLRQAETLVRDEWFWRAALGLYLLVMYGHSLMPADLSSMESGTVLRFLQGLMDAVHLPGEALTEHMVRKAAHFLEYAGMGALLFVNFRIMVRQRRETFMSMALCSLAVPFVDETIQLFVQGRSGQISDVWLDMAGIWTGILIVWLATGALGSERRRRRLR